MKKLLKYRCPFKREKARIFRENKETQYPFMRWALASCYCSQAVGNQDGDSLTRWQNRRQYYRQLLSRLRPRINEFGSY